MMNVMDTINEYDRAQQRAYPWACGSCNSRGAPGYCARTMTHGNRPSPRCGCYYPSTATLKAMQYAASRGIFTGDGFTTRIETGHSPREADVYLWVWKEGECDFIDFYPDTRVWIQLDPRGVRLRAMNDDEEHDIPFDKIKSIWLQRGFNTLAIYSR